MKAALFVVLALAAATVVSAVVHAHVQLVLQGIAR